MGQKLDYRTLSSLCGQMGLMLRAGVRPEEAVETLCADARGADGAALLKLKAELAEGRGFAEAVGSCGAFPDYAAELIAMGETAGRLDQSLEALRDYYDRQDLVRTRLKTSLRYPLVLLLLMCVVLAVLVFAVLPVFTGVYESLAGSLVGSAYAYVTAAGVIARLGLVLTVIVSAAALAATAAAGPEEKGRRARALALKLPAVRESLRYMEAARAASMLSGLLRSGMTAETALRTALEGSKGGLLGAELGVCQEDVARGESLGRSLQRQKLFPPVSGRLLLAAEESGQLDAGLAEAAEQTGREGLDGLCRVIDGVEPCLTAFLTVAVGLSLLSAMLPLIGILGAIG